MNKDFRHAVFLTLFFSFHPELYKVTYKSVYRRQTSPMNDISEIIGNDRFQEAVNYADKLTASPPKVVE